MTDLTAREVVEKLHQYDDLPSFPKINIHFLATVPGNEHLLKFSLLAVWRGLRRPPNPCRAGRLAPPGMFLGSAGKGRFFVPA